jgi:hypothetical protein
VYVLRQAEIQPIQVTLTAELEAEWKELRNLIQPGREGQLEEDAESDEEADESEEENEAGRKTSQS